jgi:Glycosyltransferase family 87
MLRSLGRLRGGRPLTAAPLLLVSGAAVGTSSVSRYDGRIVACYVALLALLAAGTWRLLSRRADGPGIPRSTGSAALVAAGVLIWTVPAFTYVTGPAAGTIRAVGAGGAVLAGIVLALPWRHAAGAALTVAAATYTATAAAALRLDPAPRIDVWYTLQGAADALLRPADMYREVWIGPPGPMPFFTYLPGTAVLLAPGRWLAGDVRWALVAVTLAAVVAVRALGRGSGTTSATVAAALLAVLPGTLTQVEQAWTEPLLLACLAFAVLALDRGYGTLAVLAVGLALASKQHIALLLPVLAAWPRFGPRRAAGAAGVAALVVLPWAVADLGALWHDTVTLLVNFPPLLFADTLYIAAVRELGVHPPFWLTGAVVVGVVAAAAVAARRFDPSPAVLLRCCALVLLVANLVNKQAFYNQYWLVAALVLVAWAADRPASAT